MGTNKQRFAVVTNEFNPCRKNEFMYQLKRLMHFKAAATYAAKIIRDVQNVSYDGYGNPRWSKQGFHLSLHDETGYEVATFGWRGISYDTVIEGDAAMWAAVQYVIAAMRNAKRDVLEDARREMTPSEIEKEFGLARGTVRKYINEHKELVKIGVVRKADARTWLVKRGWVLYRWGK